MPWFILIIVVPILVPLGAAFLFHDISESIKTRPSMLIKDGQLAWTGMAFAGAGIFECLQFQLNPLIGWLIGGFVVIIVGAVLVAMAGVAFPTRLSSTSFRTTASDRAWVITVVAAALFAVVHFGPELHSRYPSLAFVKSPY